MDKTQNIADRYFSYCRSEMKMIYRKIDNANRYSKSMYYSSSLNRITRHHLQLISNSFYGLLSLEFEDQMINSRYAYLKAFIKYRLINYYKKELPNEQINYCFT